jgi:hypothetical protein
MAPGVRNAELELAPVSFVIVNGNRTAAIISMPRVISLADFGEDFIPILLVFLLSIRVFEKSGDDLR